MPSADRTVSLVVASAPDSWKPSTTGETGGTSAAAAPPGEGAAASVADADVTALWPGAGEPDGWRSPSRARLAASVESLASVVRRLTEGEPEVDLWSRSARWSQ
jgi:hypothetical protein